MSYLKIKLVGDSPLLMNNPASMKSDGDKPSPVKVYDPEKEAAKKAYWNKDKTSLVVPALCVQAMMVVGCDKRYKIAKLSAKSYVAGCVTVKPEHIPLNTTEYEIDERTVVIQRSRVFCWRPRFNEWQIEFDLIYDEDIFVPGSEKLLVDLLNDCGKRVGLLDYRPAKKGPFGRFHVEKWEIV